ATIADGIAVRQVGALTLELARQWVDRVVTVNEEELANAVLLLLEIEKTVVEGAGAAPLAALLNRGVDLEGRRVALVLSGGNIDVTMLARIIERGLVKDGRLVRLGVLLRDIPGALARLTAVIAEERANILQILHDRAFSPHAAIGQTKVELTLETSGPEQIAAVKRRRAALRRRVHGERRMIGDRDPTAARPASARRPGLVSARDRHRQHRHSERGGEPERAEMEAAERAVHAAPPLGKDHHDGVLVHQAAARRTDRARVAPVEIDGKRAQQADEATQERHLEQAPPGHVI